MGSRRGFVCIICILPPGPHRGGARGIFCVIFIQFTGCSRLILLKTISWSHPIYAITMTGHCSHTLHPGRSLGVRGRSKIRWTNLRNPLKTGYSLKINMGGSFTYMAGPKFAHSQVLYLWQDRRICRRRFLYYGRTEEFAVRYDRACECGRQSVPAGDGSSSFLRQALSTERRKELPQGDRPIRAAVPFLQPLAGYISGLKRSCSWSVFIHVIHAVRPRRTQQLQAIKW